MKKGDIVRPTDHSYHISLLPNGEPTHTMGQDGIYRNDRLVVMQTDCAFPSISTWDPAHVEILDVLLWNDTKKYYVFFMSKFLRVVVPCTCQCDKCDPPMIYTQRYAGWRYASPTCAWSL
jgi:hypothetical protein